MAYKRISPQPVTEGGTGAQTFTAHGVLVGEGTSAIAATTAGSTNEVLLGNTGADPSFGAVPNAALANSTITVAAGTNITVSGSPVALGGTVTINANASAVTYNYTPIAFAASPYSVIATDYYIGVTTTGGAVTIRLPNAPSTGRTVVVKDVVGNAAVSNITVTTVGGAVNIDGATSFVMNTAYQAASFIFNGSTWEIF